MFREFWKKAAKVVLAASIVLCFLLAVELIRAYQTLREMNPYVGYAYLVVLAVLAVWLAVRLLGGWRYRPGTLRPPHIEDFAAARPRELRRYARYLVRYLRRLATNESLAEPQRLAADAAADRLAHVRGPAVRRNPGAAAPGNSPPYGGTTNVLAVGDNALLAACRAAEADAVEPLLAELDKLARAEVSGSVRDVMVGVAASPWPLADAFIVIYCNGRMVSRVTHIYNSRPPLREQLGIFADTARIVATIKLTFLMRKLLESFARSMPLVGRVAESLTQAVVSGVLTSAAGHAARHRCRAFRGWDRREAAADMRAHLGQFLRDCRQIAMDNLVGVVGRLYQSSTEKVGEALRTTFDAASDAADTFVVRPVAAGGRHVAQGVRWSWRGLSRLWGRGTHSETGARP
jgi:uncharacterized protein (DUF697 family)